MKTVRFTDDKSSTRAPVVKMICDCGWVEKAFRRSAKERAKTHIRVNHGEGLMEYKGETQHIKQYDFMD